MSASTTFSIVLLSIFAGPFFVALCVLLWRMVMIEPRVRKQEEREMDEVLRLRFDPFYKEMAWLDNEPKARELAHQLKIGTSLTAEQYKVFQRSREFVSKFNGVTATSWWHTQQLTGACVGCGYPLSSVHDDRRASWGCPRCKR